MLAEYEDIRKRIKDPIQWYDENGVPRYDKFHPHSSPNIYAEECALIEIACQACKERFLVEMSYSINSFKPLLSKLSRQITFGTIHYGDPPGGCCDVGATMNCDDLRVIEFWERNKKTGHEWKRNKKYEKKVN